MIDHQHCQELVATLSEYIDGELSSELCADLEAHLRGCDNCRAVVNTMRKTIDLYHDSAGTESLPDPVRERLYHHLNLEDYLKR